MIRVEAETLTEAYSKAAENLNCSVTELNITVLQNPKKGIFGFLQKKAIISAEIKNKEEKKGGFNKKSSESFQKDAKKYTLMPQEKIEEAAKEIEKLLQNLMKYSCFDLDTIKVRAGKGNSVVIEINGNDAALLIGKEGYRYKAFSYMIYNWINIKYQLNIRLEIAEFLKNQEEMIKKYLSPVKERIKQYGRGQTKPLDGVLVKIALEELREEFKDKYVSIKTNKDGDKYINVNDFIRR